MNMKIIRNRAVPVPTAAVGGCVLLTLLAVAESAETASPILSNLSFEQLSQIQVTTASKRPEALADTPSAVFVLTGEDIHRLGVKV